MSAGFTLLCVVAAVVPLAILYLLYGPPRARPLVVMPRASLAAVPMVNVARMIPVTPRLPVPMPPPRVRQVRGSAPPPPGIHVRRDTTEQNPFSDEGPTHVG